MNTENFEQNQFQADAFLEKLDAENSPLAINVRNVFTEQGNDAQKVYDYITLTELPRLREESRLGIQELSGQGGNVPNEAEIVEMIKDWQEVADELLEAMVGKQVLNRAVDWVKRVDEGGKLPEMAMTKEVLAEMHRQMEDIASQKNALAKTLLLMWPHLSNELLSLKPYEVKGMIIQAVTANDFKNVEAYDLAQLTHTIEGAIAAMSNKSGVPK